VLASIVNRSSFLVGDYAISDEMRAVVEELWPELAHKLPPKKPQG
jgi:hypothetical protein